MYYGNIEAQCSNLERKKMYRKMMKVLAESENELLENLKDNELSDFQKFSDAWSYVNAETNRDSFKTGFSLGIKCMIDVFDN